MFVEIKWRINLVYFMLAWLCVTIGSLGETFKLKNGDLVQGTVKSENETEMVLEIPYGTIVLKKDQIASENELVKVPATHREAVAPKAQKKIPAANPGKMAAYSYSEKFNQSLLKWLMDRSSIETGLVESYFPTELTVIQNYGATYDQALAGLAFFYHGYMKEASRIADYFAAKWGSQGFSNFIHIKSGYPGFERICHLGPNAWVGLFISQMYQHTSNEEYLKLLKNIVDWCLKLPEKNGASCMSDQDETRAQWSRIYSTENNIDLYALLSRIEGWHPFKDKLPRIRNKLERLEYYFRNVAIQEENNRYKIARGGTGSSLDWGEALDTYSWLILGFGAGRLEKWNIDLKKLYLSLEEKFLVEVDGLQGFDFTDANERQKIGRSPMISVEWTCGVISALKHMGQNAGNADWQKYCFDRAVFFMENLKKMSFQVTRDTIGLPYSSHPDMQVFLHPEWWKTPSDGKHGNKAGSVASVAWFLMCQYKNPFQIYQSTGEK